MNQQQTDRKAQVRTQFNTIATDYDAGPGCFAHFGRRLVAVADIKPGQRVLDVASGRGAVLFPAAESVGSTGEVVGIDLADEMARATNDEAARRGLRSRVQVMDAENLDFPAATFDRVLCGFGVMFFPNQQGALAGFRRVLKPDGRLVVSTWHLSQAREIEAIIHAMGGPAKPPGWITDPEELKDLLSRAGFADVRVDLDAHVFRYADIDEYWQQARGTGLRRALDSLDAAQTERLRNALADRVRAHQRADGLHLSATALLATGSN
jgi:ubiquinone/menaquinone biosynthesis C-methylase UbiE